MPPWRSPAISGGGQLRADRLKASVAARETDLRRLEARAQGLEQEIRTLRQDAQVALTATQAHREKLETRYEASEARWLLDVDRARQALKAAALDRERSVKESQRRIDLVEKSKAVLTREVQQTRSELKVALKVQGQLKKALAAKKRLSSASGSTKSTARPRNA